MAFRIRATQVLVFLPLLALGGFAFFGCWFGVYMLTVWPYAI